MTPKNELALGVVLDEFEALRDEIQNRPTAAYSILNIHITAIADVAELLLSKKGDLKLLLISPFRATLYPSGSSNMAMLVFSRDHYSSIFMNT